MSVEGTKSLGGSVHIEGGGEVEDARIQERCGVFPAQGFGLAICILALFISMLQRPSPGVGMKEQE